MIFLSTRIYMSSNPRPGSRRHYSIQIPPRQHPPISCFGYRPLFLACLYSYFSLPPPFLHLFLFSSLFPFSSSLTF
ncbi:uncharacterized protein EURHEDRAFT_308796 [Aspergillus ruber CBS 135680]|uniref:Uncharacterized protein n=1 Tax=Aspergillus ruber (strain CBS 135680) TaxID=1388766 RepID=A0A017S0L8_ASPRC|nr:uncharacterized protein EURHEDRAFT_308796 [Aspergillus ruber CBS 135680]EYE90396.1 hypothetical protein EURHEDRAFT_308796 [Aspergillus ruber CBS 135680]